MTKIISPRDPYFQVETLQYGTSCSPNLTIYMAMHQDYCEYPVYWELPSDWNVKPTYYKDSYSNWNVKSLPSEVKAGEIILDKLLHGSFHPGPFEHPQLVLNFANFPHSIMQQMRTHRHCSFDVQSLRYTGQRIVDFVEGLHEFDEIFYIRPVGDYQDRQGNKVTYTAEQRDEDIAVVLPVIQRYAERFKQGFPPEHCRSIIPFDVRQSWVMSGNARTIMHLLDMRWPADAQWEAQQLAELMFKQFQIWMPQVAHWYKEKRAQKSKLAF